MEGFDEFKNILVGVDESEGAQKAFQYAVKQASKTGAALLIASILEIEELNVYEALDPEYLSQKQSQLLLNLEKYKQYYSNAGSIHSTVDNRQSRSRRKYHHRSHRRWKYQNFPSLSHHFYKPSAQKSGKTK